KAKEIPLKVFCFDLLNLNGQSLLSSPFYQRRRELEKIISSDKNNLILLTEQTLAKTGEEFNKFFSRVVNEGLEGLMAKKSDSIYQAGARNFNWVKFKAGMTKDLVDTIDCVVMGYYQGLGKRNQFGIGAFIVGVPDGEQILTVSKIGTGLTDEQWREMYKRIEKIKAAEKPKEYIVNKNLFPDVWCEPKLVVEIEADMITKSPIHTAGLALRFPRLKNFRDDKNADQATNLEELKELSKL
ncbi:MAG: DNA ligase, partial [Candidatus Shapirobacteria bacterium]|nr:DNA ligase [Candidatus Shapirobacteria bacterium]